MRSGATPETAQQSARKAKLGFSVAGFTVGGAGGLRARMAADLAGEAVRAAARAGVVQFDGPEGAEASVAEVGQARFTLHMAPDCGPDQIAGRLGLARARLARSAETTLILCGTRLLATDGDALWTTAMQLRKSGECVAVGVSVEPGGEALGMARRFKPDVMQVQAGLLDQRLIASGALGAIAGLGIEVHLRTTLLHGLLFMPREGLPAALAEAGRQLSQVRRMIAEGGADPLQAALAFALDRPEASRVIVEAGSVSEVRAILAAAGAPSPRLDWPSMALDHCAALDAEAGLSRRAA
jgi:hypothetical protein